MYLHPFVFSMLLVLASYSTLNGPLSAAEEAGADVRVLVDISGSMKKNDPANLRVPAIKLLANMMPAETQAGVWTFARYVNMLVKHGPVNNQWKMQATEQAEKISSVGLYTDIGTALEKAVASWLLPAPSPNTDTSASKSRSIILLTDGMVDVSKNPADSEQSRQRILNDLIPKLKASGITVHTIALSDKADKELLQTLSVATDGLFSIAPSSDDLLKVFLQAFDQSVEQDEVPLTGNKFLIDASVEEFTVLAFTVPGSLATELRDPKGKVFTKDSLAKGVNWLHDSHYDLITVTDPQAGEWTLLADLDPANRVTVVSDLELSMQDMPTNIILGDELVLTVSLENHGKTVVQPEFLSLIDLSFRQEHVGHDKVWEGKLTSNQEGAVRVPEDGMYSAKLSQTLLDGEHEFNLVLDGRTFQRKRNHRLTVHGTLVDGILVEQEKDGGTEYFLNTVPIANLVNTESVTLHAEISTPSENSIEAEVSKTDFGTWKVNVPPIEGDGLYRVFLRVEGETLNGRPVDIRQPAILVPYRPEQISAKFKSNIDSSHSSTIPEDNFSEEKEDYLLDDEYDDEEYLDDEEMLEEEFEEEEQLEEE